MAFVLQIKPKAEKALDKLPEKYRLRIRQIFRNILLDPFSGKNYQKERRTVFCPCLAVPIIYSIEKGTYNYHH